MRIINCRGWATGGTCTPPVLSSDSVYLHHCFFYKNFAPSTTTGITTTGGAVQAMGVWADSCTFAENGCLVNTFGDSNPGGAIGASKVNISFCTFIHNYTNSPLQGGGAIYCGGGPIPSTSVIYHCEFYRNSALTTGGAIWDNTYSPGILIKGNIFWDDSSLATAGVNDEILVESTVGHSGGCNWMPDTAGNNNFVPDTTDVFGVNPQFGSLGYYGDCVPTLPILNSLVAQAWDSCTGISHVITTASYIKEEFMSVYPNPSHNYWHLTVSTNFIGGEAIVTDANGRVVFQSLIVNRSSLIGADVPRGVYLLRVSSSRSSVVRKMVKL